MHWSLFGPTHVLQSLSQATKLEGQSTLADATISVIANNIKTIAETPAGLIADAVCQSVIAIIALVLSGPIAFVAQHVAWGTTAGGAIVIIAWLASARAISDINSQS